MKLRALVFPLASIAGLLTIFGQGRAPRSETKRLHDRVLTGPAPERLAAAKKLGAASAYGKLPLSFEANQGQTDPQVKFISRGSGYSLFLTATEAVLTLKSSNRASKVEDQKSEIKRAGLFSRPEIVSEFLGKRSATDLQEKSAVGQTVLRMKLAGANSGPRIWGVDELPGKSHYFIGNDPKKWRADVPTYAKVKYQRVYPGVDLVYHGTQGKLEYDFVVAPGADPGVIRLSFEGADRVEIDGQGDLVLHTAAGEVREHKPVVYQEVAGARHAVSGSYVLRGQREAGFAIARYDAGQPLIIDPVLSYSTYLGGGGFDEGLGIAVDSTGNAYVTGYTDSVDFPSTSGAYQPASGGGTCGTPPNTFACSDAFVTKLNANGSALVYSTYLGGSGNDYGASIAVDSIGNAYITGSTVSSNFPTTPGGFQTTFEGTTCGTAPYTFACSRAFVTKLNATGSTLVYSTYLGGSGDDHGRGIVVDSAGNAYVTGYTNSSNFPTTSGAFQTSIAGGTCGTAPFAFPCRDAFMTKLNANGSAPAYSTYLGGSGDDLGYGTAVDSAGNAYVTGQTSSTGFPTTADAFQTSSSGSTCGTPPNTFACSHAFVTKLNPAGNGRSDLVYSSYLGGSGSESGFGIAVEPGCGGPAPATPCNVYVTGYTGSNNFPTIGAPQTTLGGFIDVFVAKLKPVGGGPSDLAYSTYLGGPQRDEGFGIAVDSSGNAYVTGAGDSGTFPVVNAFQRSCGGCQHQGPDGFVAKIDPTKSGPDSLVYSSFIGGVSFDSGYGIAVDPSGNAYVTGVGGAGFPITPGAFQTSFGGQSGNAFVAKISPPNDIPGFTLTSASLSFGNQAVNTNSPPRAVIVGDAGTGPLTITSIMITGTNPAEFVQNNTCGTSVTGGANCTITVTFAPTTIGPKTAAIIITDNAVGSPHTVNLTGTGATFSVSPLSLYFGSQGLGTTSTPRVVTLSNVSGAASSFVSITTAGTNSGDFAQANNCPISPSTLAAGASCTINVTFTPAASGYRSATMTITDSAGTPYTVALAGNGMADFTTSASPSTTTIAAGQSATYTLTVTPAGFTGSVSLSCVGAPAAATCSVSPASVTLSGTSAATATATVTTTVRGLLAPWPKLRLPPATFSVRGWPLWPVCLLVLVVLAHRTKSRRRAAGWVFAASVFVALLGVACGRGGSASRGTPPGTSTLTITGTSGSLSHTTTVTLVVN